MDLDPELLKTEKGRFQLAIEFARILNEDTTQPVPHPDNWVGEKMLRDFECVVVQKEKLYQEFADFCRVASTMARAEVRALFILGWINGLRRLPETERPDDLIKGLLEDLTEEIELFKDSPRKKRLILLSTYHAGIFTELSGDYSMAVQFHHISTELARSFGDKRGEVISRFCAAATRVNRELVLYPLGKGAKLKLADLRKAGEELNNVLGKMPEDSTTVRWLYLNAPLTLTISHFLAGVQYDSSMDLFRIGQIFGKDKGLYFAVASEIKVFRAINFFSRNLFDIAALNVKIVIEDRYRFSPPPEYLAIAHFVLARVEAEIGGEGKEKALQTLEKMKPHIDAVANVEGAYVVQAVASSSFEFLRLAVNLYL